MKKLLLALAFAAGLAPQASGFGFGLTSAVKGKVRELDRKVAAGDAGRTLPLTTRDNSGNLLSGCGDADRVAWCAKGDIYYYSSPAIAADGTVYAGTSHHFNIYNGYWSQGLTPPVTGYGLVAFNAAGGEKWRFLTGKPARGGAAVADDGTIYMVFENLANSEAGTTEDLYAITSTGTVKWILPDIGDYAQIGALTPAIAPDGTIYVQGRRLWAVNPDGTVKWQVLNGAFAYNIFSSPAIAGDGTVLAVCWPNEASVCGYSPADGTRLWAGPDFGTYPITGSPVPADSGTVYLGARDDHNLSGGGAGTYALFSISTGTVTGTLKWAFPVGPADIRSSPAIAPDGTLYFGTKGSYKLYALNSDGTQRWVYDQLIDGGGGAEGDVYSSPAIDSAGKVYFANELGYLYSFNPDGTLNWKYNAGGGAINWSSPAIADDGTLYFGTTYSYFFAVKTGSSGLLTGAPWPKFHKDNRNTGRR